MRSKQKTLTIKQLRNLLGNCLKGGLTLALFLPDEEIRPPTWQEVREAAIDGYALALEDVLEAIEGDTQGLDLARSKAGRIAVREEDWSRYEALVGKDLEEDS